MVSGLPWYRVQDALLREQSEQVSIGSRSPFLFFESLPWQ